MNHIFFAGLWCRPRWAAPAPPPSSCRRSPGSDTRHEALLRYPGFWARHRRRLALRHQHFNLTKQHNNLLRAKPLPRHLQAPLPVHSLTRSGPKKPSQIDFNNEVTGNPPCVPFPSDEYRSPTLGAAERLAGVAGAWPVGEPRHCRRDTAFARKMAWTYSDVSRRSGRHQ